MQIPILNGIYTDEQSDFRTSYPVNMIPVPKTTGISEGYLRPADGIIQFGAGPGIDRGGINWNGVCYRVMGSKLVSISSSGVLTTIGDVGSDGKQVSFDYSFDRLAIASNQNLYYLQGTSLTRVIDTDLGSALDVKWVDGYFMTTDGDYLVVTELTDPTSVNPLKYGSSEADPDKIKGLLKLRNEIYALNRYTIEAFQNVGGDNFPFSRIEGAYIMRGTVGTHAFAMFLESIAFVGGGRNEQVAVWIGSNGSTTKISTREIDQILQEYAEAQLSEIVCEVRITNGHQFLYVHLPNKTLVYDGAASQTVSMPVWFILASSVNADSTYRARNFVYCYDKWLCADPTSTKHGYLTNEISSHYGDLTGWEFGTAIAYNNSMGAIFHQLELVALTGRAEFGDDPVIFTQYSIDGENWSQERPRRVGKSGERNRRIVWLQNGFMRNFRIQKFKGTSDCHVAVARLEATLEALNV